MQSPFGLDRPAAIVPSANKVLTGAWTAGYGISGLCEPTPPTPLRGIKRCVCATRRSVDPDRLLRQRRLERYGVWRERNDNGGLLAPLSHGALQGRSDRPPNRTVEDRDAGEHPQP